MDNTKVTRFEVITNEGRLLVREGVRVRLSYQDKGKTLKVFVFEDRPLKRTPGWATRLAKAVQTMYDEED